ncbi:hypothetical protein FSP39_013461 [Pinctada imbricata]|uniref:Uncharacterized protein n=1 Tax=Pinctada imbricata TaxID=66713 RepID=A0AA89CC46_PINIB|nr:hypothetical protein FSP39_013461 [Pinctada imbricata]
MYKKLRSLYYCSWCRSTLQRKYENRTFRFKNQKWMKREDVKDIVKEVVKEIVKETKEEIAKSLEKMEKRNEKIYEKLENRIQRLEVENNNLKEKMSEIKKENREMKSDLSDAVIIAREAQRKSNYNEQYSRKNNVKVHGIPEDRGESVFSVAEQSLKDVANIQLEESDVVAIHRIPGPKGSPRPILIKLKNTGAKARIMKNRKRVRQAGRDMRLSDDVTRLNSMLLQRLNDHPCIDQAWYFNGNVYGTVKEGDGKKIQFDIHDDIEEKIKRK